MAQNIEQREQTGDERLKQLAALSLEDKIDQVLLIMWQCQDVLNAMAANPMMRAMGAKFTS